MNTSNNQGPGPRSRALARRLRAVESRNITCLAPDVPIFWESASGSTVTDVDGRRYLDLTAAFGVAALGHTPPAVGRMIMAQSRTLWHGMGDVHPARVKVELLQWLSRHFPGGRGKSILATSGAEAVEAALKTARIATGRRGVLVFEGGYHGLTYGALEATHGPEFRDPFADQLGRFSVRAPYPDSLRGPSEDACLVQIERLLKSPSPRPCLPLAGACGRSWENRSAGPLPRRGEGAIGAILIEPMQARGGVRIPRPFFLREVAALAKRYGVLLIADEIYTGFGRTGRRFGVDHSMVKPDLLCLGKALSNGFPISACVGSTAVMDAWPPSDGEAIHTSTHLGNPLGCAMALAAVGAMEKNRRIRLAARTGARWIASLRDRLGAYPVVGDIRGIGLMAGIEIVSSRRHATPDPVRAGRLVRGSLAKGLIVLSGGIHRNVITLTPPLTISDHELDRATRILEEVFHGDLGRAC